MGMGRDWISPEPTYRDQTLSRKHGQWAYRSKGPTSQTLEAGSQCERGAGDTCDSVRTGYSQGSGVISEVSEVTLLAGAVKPAVSSGGWEAGSGLGTSFLAPSLCSAWSSLDHRGRPVSLALTAVRAHMDMESPAASSRGGKIWVREMEYFNGRLNRIKAFVLVSWRSRPGGSDSRTSMPYGSRQRLERNQS